MKVLIVFALAFAKVPAKNLYYHSNEVPVLENEGPITNGYNAAPGQFKYQVGLSLQKTALTEWCGGSLIGANWVLSAAHCTLSALSAMVFLGTTQREVADKVYNASKGDIITHPEFSLKTFENDISLIRIPTTSESSRIGIVRISSNDEKHVGDGVVVSGWGLKSDYSNNLQYDIRKVSPGSLCSKFDGDFSDRTRICIATPNRVSGCGGDPGGPLVLVFQKLQIGLLSYYNTHGCDKGFPVVFTRVGFYHLWIKSHTGISEISKL